MLDDKIGRLYRQTKRPTLRSSDIPFNFRVPNEGANYIKVSSEMTAHGHNKHQNRRNTLNQRGHSVGQATWSLAPQMTCVGRWTDDKHAATSSLYALPDATLNTASHIKHRPRNTGWR